MRSLALTLSQENWDPYKKIRYRDRHRGKRMRRHAGKRAMWLEWWGYTIQGTLSITGKLQRLKETRKGSSCHGPAVTNLTRIHEDAGLIPGLAQWIKDQYCQELWCSFQMRLRPCVAGAVGRGGRQSPPFTLTAGTSLCQSGGLKKKKKKKKRHKNGFSSRANRGSLTADISMLDL